jgi:hypothetical protein
MTERPAIGSRVRLAASERRYTRYPFRLGTVVRHVQVRGNFSKPCVAVLWDGRKTEDVCWIGFLELAT